MVLIGENSWEVFPQPEAVGQAKQLNLAEHKALITFLNPDRLILGCSVDAQGLLILDSPH